MEFDLASAQEVLKRTPATLSALARDLSESWVRQTEGPGTWSVFDVVGHLIHGEQTDWIPRARLILQHGASRTFERFDRTAQFQVSRGRSLNQLLDEFSSLRTDNLAALAGFRLGPEQLALEGRHPELGLVTLRQLLSTWVAHDLDHVVQVSRVMAKRYAQDVGPWKAYLRVLS